jgi:uncharacterized protein YerC
MPRKKSRQPRILTTEERKTRNEAILAALRQGKLYRHIAIEFGVSLSTVGIVARRNEFGRDRNIGTRSIISAEQKYKIIDLLHAGERYKDIAHQMGTSISTIHHIARKLGIKRIPGPKLGTHHDSSYNTIMQLRREGHSLRSIAEKLGTSYQNISQRLKSKRKNDDNKH